MRIIANFQMNRPCLKPSHSTITNVTREHYWCASRGGTWCRVSCPDYLGHGPPAPTPGSWIVNNTAVIIIISSPGDPPSSSTSINVKCNWKWRHVLYIIYNILTFSSNSNTSSHKMDFHDVWFYVASSWGYVRWPKARHDVWKQVHWSQQPTVVIVKLECHVLPGRWTRIRQLSVLH